MTPHEQMIISALRYALPRRSYITANTEDYIRNMTRLSQVSDSFIEVAIKDIEQHKEYIPNPDLTEHDWTPLLEDLKKLL